MHILAVDDDPIILEIIVEVVRSMGDHEASIAESAMEAIGLINTAPVGTYDCCLLDIQMPGTDGIALCKMLRGRKDFRSVPIVMLTAMSDKRYVDAAFAAGANDYIVKPFEVVELQRRIRQAEQRAIRTQAVPGSAQAQAEATGKPDLAEAFHIFDVDNLIDYPALENYLPLLSQPTLYNTVALGFHIRQAAEIHGLCSGLQFRGLIEDVAETISDTLRSQEFLMAYAGRGTFLCVVQENTIRRRAIWSTRSISTCKGSTCRSRRRMACRSVSAPAALSGFSAIRTTLWPRV
ncbi:MAG: response regulator [Paracoccaceae bacterium]